MSMISLAAPSAQPAFRTELVEVYHCDCFDWLRACCPYSIHAVVTDPPFSPLEYSREHLDKMKSGRGGVWRIPPSIGGNRRAPVPRFTILSRNDLRDLYQFFRDWGDLTFPVLVPGAHLFIASSVLLNHILQAALIDAGFERRGEIARLVRTLRGGDRPKGGEAEFPEVSAMPRACWEPWMLFRKPLAGTLVENLRKWGVGGLRRPDRGTPFSDVIPSQRTPSRERQLAPHPTLKPQSFLRALVRASLPTGFGVILDPFAGSGSTLAAAQALGLRAIGIEKEETYVSMCASAIPHLAALRTPQDPRIL